MSSPGMWKAMIELKKAKVAVNANATTLSTKKTKAALNQVVNQ